MDVKGRNGGNLKKKTRASMDTKYNSREIFSETLTLSMRHGQLKKGIPNAYSIKGTKPTTRIQGGQHKQPKTKKMTEGGGNELHTGKKIKSKRMIRDAWPKMGMSGDRGGVDICESVLRKQTERRTKNLH